MARGRCILATRMVVVFAVVGCQFVCHRHYGAAGRSHVQCHNVFLVILSPEDGSDTVSRNVANKLVIAAAQRQTVT